MYNKVYIHTLSIKSNYVYIKFDGISLMYSRLNFFEAIRDSTKIFKFLPFTNSVTCTWT